MLFAYIAIAIMISIGSADAWYSPQASFELSDSADDEPPSCREETATEAFSESNSQKGKAATFSLSGRYRCQKDIFEPGERSAFYTFVAERAQERINSDLAQISEKFRFSGYPLLLRVISEDPKIATYISTVLRESAFAHFPSKALHLDPLKTNESSYVVQAKVREVVDEDLFLEITIKKRLPNTISEEVLWQRGS